MVAAAEPCPRMLRDFLLLLGLLFVLTGGGCDSRSKSAEEAARRAEREFASPVATPVLFDEEPAAPAPVALASGCDEDAFDVDAAEDLLGRGAMNESCTRSYADWLRSRSDETEECSNRGCRHR